MYYIILFSLFTVLGFTETVSLITTRNDKSLIEGYLSTPNTNKKFPLLVFVDGVVA